MEERIRVKYFFLKGHGSKLIPKGLVSTLQEIQIRRSFLRRRRTGWNISDFYGLGSSALSEEVSRRKRLSNGRAFLSGSGDDQEHS
jgi:hypothetical protein